MDFFYIQFAVRCEEWVRGYGVRGYGSTRPFEKGLAKTLIMGWEIDFSYIQFSERDEEWVW